MSERAIVASLVLLSAASVDAEPRPARLAVRGFRDAMIVAPTAPGSRPVAVALHGNFDRAEWECESWAPLVAGRAWLLCPRGVPRTDVPKSYDRWTYQARGRVRAEIEAGVAALRARHPGRVADGPLLIIGFSLGAIIGARLAVETPARLPRLVLVEGAHDVLAPENVRRFARGGGKGVVFGCGSRGCGARARRLCGALQRAGLICAEATAPDLGHTYTGPIPKLVRPHVDHMLAGDPRWATK
jgi:pimeloyl-ACP methyl ester carboxylesterase